MKTKIEINGKTYDCKIKGFKDETEPKWMYFEVETPTGSYKIKLATKVVQHGKTFNEIVIPPGWRLLELEEVKQVANSNIWREILNLKLGNNNFYFNQPFEVNKNLASWLGCSSSGFYLVADSNLSGSSAARGALFCQDVENEVKDEH